jgi:hypothetical protein
MYRQRGRSKRAEPVQHTITLPHGADVFRYESSLLTGGRKEQDVGLVCRLHRGRM